MTENTEQHLRAGSIQNAGKWLLLLLIFIGFNLIGKYISFTLVLPVWLDCVGTCLASYYLGVPGALIAGLAGNLVFGAANTVSAFYAVVSMAIGLVFCFCAKHNYLSNFTKAMISSFMVGVISVAVSTPINLCFHGGYTGNRWGDALYDMMQWYGYPKMLSAIMDEAIVDILDKQLCVVIVFLIIRAVGPGKEKRAEGIKTAAKLLAASAVLSAFLLLPADPACAAESGNGIFEYYKEQVYNRGNGMSVSEANAIEETSDGYIWIGSYAGLTRYDSHTFEFIPEDGVASVTAMMTASDGTLWIGTNDAGLMRYRDGSFTSCSKADGLPVNSIRSFAEGNDGTMYIGTTDRICRMTGDGVISVLDADVVYVNSLLV